MCKVNTGSK